MGTLLLVEGLWVLIYCLFIFMAPGLQDLSFFLTAILVLILSAVELVVGLLCFIIFYHTVNTLAPRAPAAARLNRLYQKIHNSGKSFISKFF